MVHEGEGEVRLAHCRRTGARTGEGDVAERQALVAAACRLRLLPDLGVFRSLSVFRIPSANHEKRPFRAESLGQLL